MKKTILLGLLIIVWLQLCGLNSCNDTSIGVLNKQPRLYVGNVVNITYGGFGYSWAQSDKTNIKYELYDSPVVFAGDSLYVVIVNQESSI